MITIILSLLVLIVGYILYALHIRVEKISTNQAIMVQWCDTLRQNEETLLHDFKQLKNEFQTIKEIKSK
jgi:hypothetical protein